MKETGQRCLAHEKVIDAEICCLSVLMSLLSKQEVMMAIARKQDARFLGLEERLMAGTMQEFVAEFRFD